MKTPLQIIIERFETGVKIHDKQMNNKSLSNIEINRASYLKFNCESVVAVATDLLEKEKQVIIDAWEHGYSKEDTDSPMSIQTSKQYYNETFKS